MDRVGKGYSDWFGDGNTVDDVNDAVEEHGMPKQIFYGGNMAALVYPDKVVCVGYDGEYCHTFIMDEKDSNHEG